MLHRFTPGSLKWYHNKFWDQRFIGTHFSPHTVLEVGRDETGWHPVSFRKAPKPSICLLTVAKSSRHLFSRFETTPGIIIVLHEFER
jgi:hypothetical protein